MPSIPRLRSERGAWFRPARADNLIFISAGEASGDLYGSLVARELRKRNPRIKLSGFGGKRMAAAGVRMRSFPLASGMLGWTGVIRRIPAILSLFRRLRRSWRVAPPRAVLLIDNPGFNMRMAGIAREFGIPVYYYVCPQVWAWGAQRLIGMRRLLTQAFPILPFEEPLFQAFGIRARFVGHPLLEVIPRLRRARARTNPHMLLLPGSRKEEISRHLPLLLEAAGRLAAEIPKTDWTVAVTPETTAQATVLAARSRVPALRVVSGADYALRARADLSWTASGTATLEQGLLGVPQIAVYRMNRLNWWIITRMATVQHVCLVNLILGRPSVPELLQSDFTVDNLIGISRQILRSRRAADQARRDSDELRSRLTGSGASATVADVLVRELKS